MYVIIVIKFFSKIFKCTSEHQRGCLCTCFHKLHYAHEPESSRNQEHSFSQVEVEFKY
jgi:hypothetical protein